MFVWGVHLIGNKTLALAGQFGIPAWWRHPPAGQGPVPQPPATPPHPQQHPQQRRRHMGGRGGGATPRGPAPGPPGGAAGGEARGGGEGGARQSRPGGRRKTEDPGLHRSGAAGSGDERLGPRGGPRSHGDQLSLPPAASCQGGALTAAAQADTKGGSQSCWPYGMCRWMGFHKLLCPQQ